MRPAATAPGGPAWGPRRFWSAAGQRSVTPPPSGKPEMGKAKAQSPNKRFFRKKKRHSCAAPKVDLVTSIPCHPEDPEYVRVSKTEYEEFKNRVSAIGKFLSQFLITSRIFLGKIYKNP